MMYKVSPDLYVRNLKIRPRICGLSLLTRAKRMFFFSSNSTTPKRKNLVLLGDSINPLPTPSEIRTKLNEMAGFMPYEQTEVNEARPKFMFVGISYKYSHRRSHGVFYPSLQLHSARTKLLYSWVVMELLRSNRLYGQNFDDLLHSGLRNMEDLVVASDKSLVIATCYSKYLSVLGQYDVAEKECYRALQIDNPDDPRYHDISLGSTKGKNYADRVSSLRMQIKDLISIVLLVVDQFSEMSEEQKGHPSFIES